MLGRTGTVIAVLAVLAFAAVPAAASQTPPAGAILTFAGTGFGSPPSLYGVDPGSGQRTELSDQGNANEGPTVSPYRLAAGAGVVVAAGLSPTSADHGLLVQFDPATGQRTLISDFTNPSQGPVGYVPFGVAVESSDTFLVTDRGQGGGGNGAALWLVSGGMRTKISDFNNSAQGPTGSSPEGVARDPSGNVYVADTEAGTQCNLPDAADFCGALFRVDPTTGQRTVVSDFGKASQGPTGEDPSGLAFDPADGTFLVLDGFAGTCGCGELFRVNVSTGARTVLTDFGNAAQGPTGGPRPVAVAVAADGTILTDGCPGTSGNGAICIINRTTGARTNFADFGDPSLGPVLIGPLAGLAFMPVVPTLRSTTTSLDCAGGTPVGQPASCTATVTDTDSGSPIVPAGTVTFSSDGSGTFSASACALTPAGGPARASCTVTYTRSNDVTQTVTAHYRGDSSHAASSGSADFTGLRPTSTSISCSPSSVPPFLDCMATVTDTGPGAKASPTGSVEFTNSPLLPWPYGFADRGGGHINNQDRCTDLAATATPGVSSCSPPNAFEPPPSSFGTITAVAKYQGDDGIHAPSSGSTLTNPSPQVSGFHQSHNIWAEGNNLAAFARHHRRYPVGTTFTLVLNTAASLKLTFTQSLSGYKAGKRCIAKSHKNRHTRPCQRTVTAGTLTFPNGHPGVNTITFQGRLSRKKKLRPGRYTLQISATAATGHSTSRKLTFTIANR